MRNWNGFPACFLAAPKSSLDLTYEELKQEGYARVAYVYEPRLDLTYEELKLIFDLRIMIVKDGRLDLTYEELKLLFIYFRFLNSF